MKFQEVADAVQGVPIMSAEQGRAIYTHVLESAPGEVLELGSAHGVSACYMAAALQENGRGHLTTLDRVNAGYDPPPERLLASCGLTDFVSVVRREDHSYNWFLKERVEERSDEQGNCEPIYDFCYIDGAHEWTIDGFAVVLVEKLLRPNGWLALDDLSWSYAAEGLNSEQLGLSDAERRASHVRAIFELIVKQHPNFTNLKIQPDLDWAWAQKDVANPRRLSIETSRSSSAVLMLRFREFLHQRRSRS